MHALFRVGKKGTKFDFELASVEAIHSAIEDKLVTLRWVRGGKSGGANKNVLATPDGRAIWSPADALCLSVTLFRSDPAGVFDAKEVKVTVDQVVRAGTTKTLATAKLDLAKFVDKMGNIKRCTSELTLIGDDGLKGRIKLSLASAIQGGLVSKQPDRDPQVIRDHSIESIAQINVSRKDRPKQDSKNDPADSEVTKGKAQSRHNKKDTSALAGSKDNHKMAAWERRALQLPSDGSLLNCA